VGGCAGGTIDSADDVEAAVAEAGAVTGVEVIGLRSFTASRAIVVDAPEGVVLRGLDDAVITGPASGFAFVLASDGAVLDDVGLRVGSGAVDVQAAGVVENVEVVASAPNVVIALAADARLERVFLRSSAVGTGGTAIRARDGALVQLAQVVVSGSFATGVDVDNVSVLELTQLTLVPVGTGAVLRRTAVCARNSLWRSLDLTNPVTASTSCTSQHNALAGGGCSGNGCSASCTGVAGGARYLCGDVGVAPFFDVDGTCPAAASGFVDTGVDTGLDLIDAAGRFVGAAPDLGARERGAVTSFGPLTLSCP
jgi:hypothetical protein